MWSDRDFVFRSLPNELKGGLHVVFPHIIPLGTSISLELKRKSRIYVILESSDRNGELPTALSKQGWQLSTTAPTIEGKKYGGQKLTMLYTDAAAGVLNIPKTRTKETCLSVRRGSIDS